jgi:DNA-binding CsgD family transcriptional regulator
MRGMDNRQQRLLDIIDLVYANMDRDQMLATLFAELRQLFAFSSGVLLPIDPLTLELQGTFSFDCAAENTERYLQHYAAFDPYACRPPHAVPLNRTVRFSDVASLRQIDRSEFADFMVRIPYRHALAAVVSMDGQPRAAFSVHRRKEQRDFGSREIALIDRIAPHLGRALALHNGRAHHVDAGVGLFAIGANGEALFMNPAARSLLPAGGLAQVLAALPPGPGSLRLGLQNYRVRRLPWRAASMLTRFALHDCDAGAGGSNERAADVPATSGSADARTTLVILEPFALRKDLRRRLAHYGLSMREVEVAENSICSGLSYAQLAQRLHISEETVKSHLRETYRKVGVGSRMALLSKVLGLDG